MHCVSRNGLATSLLVLLRGLYKFSVNDTLRSFIYYDCSIMTSLCEFMRRGNSIERKFTLRLICQLSFNSKIAEDLSKDSNLASLLSQAQTDNSGKNWIPSLDRCNRHTWFKSGLNGMRCRISELGTHMRYL